MTRLQWKFALLTLALTACDPAKGDGDDGDEPTGAQPPGDTEGDSSSTGDGQTSIDPSGDTEPSNPSEPAEGSSTTCSFICDETDTIDVGGCDLWEPDCPAGEKCMPWAYDGGSSWNSSRCSPLDDDAGAVGDACTVEGSGVSGIDSCGVDSMCWNVNEENVGTCVAFCQGTEANPVCENPATSCVIANDGFLNLCLPQCDPLLTECNDGEGCYPVNDSFACAPDASGTTGVFGDPCEFLNVCDVGLFCANAEAVPGCNAAGCCSNFCDLSIADPNSQCEADGQECVPWYEEGQTPPGLEDVAACAIPQ
ncbi:MAG: ribulose phosphate epimerase [Deltaproteobacteria bacterium]|nr:ribulose phosphate epimerase [Nannocystaceae bacterium]